MGEEAMADLAEDQAGDRDGEEPAGDPLELWREPEDASRLTEGLQQGRGDREAHERHERPLPLIALARNEPEGDRGNQQPREGEVELQWVDGERPRLVGWYHLVFGLEDRRRRAGRERQAPGVGAPHPEAAA